MSLKYVLMILLITNILGDDQDDQYYIKIKNKEYQIKLESSETANQIKSKFPLTISMNNLNGNEVYYFFNGQSFPTNEQSVGIINQGDIYLYQTNCLVLFFKTFTTNTNLYTKIGKVINPEGLDTSTDTGNVEVMWFTKSGQEENPKGPSTDKNEDSTDNNAKASDTKKINNEDEEENNFVYYSFGRFMNLNYFVWLFLSLTI